MVVPFPTEWYQSKVVCFITCVIEIKESSAFMIKLKLWNYGIWKSRMEDLLYMKDLHELFEGGEVKPADIDDKKWAQLN